jgi:phosphoenolpyruvate phosphomutase
VRRGASEVRRGQPAPLAGPAIRKTAQFRALLDSPEPEYLMEAHDGLSARVVEAEGLKGIWASGLSISTVLGVRDSNEISWSQLLDVVEFMADATNIPIVVDGDTGYGDFNNARRFARKLSQRGAAALCIEDQAFPSATPLSGRRPTLVDLAEFQGKITACKDALIDDDFCVIARTEALAAGAGLGEALDRAEAYRAAGADGILLPSYDVDTDELLRFAADWAGRAPLLVLLKGDRTMALERFRAAGVSILIWGNHTMRAALGAMRRLCRAVLETGDTTNVEWELIPLPELFTLMGYAELGVAEACYVGGTDRMVDLCGSRPSADLYPDSLGASAGS